MVYKPRKAIKWGVLTHSGCPGLPGPRRLVSPLLRLGPNTRLAGSGLSAWHPPGGRPASCPSSGAVRVSRHADSGDEGSWPARCRHTAYVERSLLRGAAARSVPGGSQALGLKCHQLPAARCPAGLGEDPFFEAGTVITRLKGLAADSSTGA
ncbi:unnamed protein product [Rangifer tarandus platyrhynchus]|uniref:Uncharacterized protein n=2 Tax=Rangifer tarandus platyrhynchus TaxID=3082113 RepID=A0ACB0F7N0_RANTA|nr:unnamed protein product [Rangifer tarandus platyrhynchus]CAI9708732.1 unnamed protein product [Rangifer tarandus platyrhynchus]